MPSSMALIGQAYADPTQRARAVAVWAMGGAVASTSGPILGGLLTSVSWRLIFAINLPVGAAALALLTRTERSPHHRVPFDWAGQLAAVLAMGGLTYGAIEAGVDGLTAPNVVVAFAVAVLALAAFVALRPAVPTRWCPWSCFAPATCRSPWPSASPSSSAITGSRSS